VTRDPRVEDLDVGQSALFLGWAMADAVQDRLRAEGFDGLRFGHGLVIQRLIDDAGPTPSAIAASIGVSLPSVSRSLRELEASGYVERRPDPQDQRSRRIHLTARGRRAVAAARDARAALDGELADELGVEAVAVLRDGLHAALRALGGEQAVAARRIRPPDGQA